MGGNSSVKLIGGAQCNEVLLSDDITRCFSVGDASQKVSIETGAKVSSPLCLGKRFQNCHSSLNTVIQTCSSRICLHSLICT